MLLFNPVKRLYSLQTINRYHRYSILSSFQTTDLPNQRTATLLSSHTPKRSLSLAPRIDPSFIDYKANAKLKQFHLSLTNNMKHLKKKMKEDIDESRVASLSSIIESRGFDISWDVEESILYLQKVNHEMNEIIHVSIYQEEVLHLPLLQSYLSYTFIGRSNNNNRNKNY